MVVGRHNKCRFDCNRYESTLPIESISFDRPISRDASDLMRYFIRNL